MRHTDIYGWGKNNEKSYTEFQKTQKRPLLFTADLEQKCKATA